MPKNPYRTKLRDVGYNRPHFVSLIDEGGRRNVPCSHEHELRSYAHACGRERAYFSCACAFPTHAPTCHRNLLQG